MALELRHILVPIDFGQSSRCALAMAIELAGRFDAQLTLAHVFEVPSYVYAGMTYVTADLLVPIEEGAREQLGKELSEAQVRIPRAKAVLRRGPPAQGVLGLIEELRPDLVVVGTHGRTGVSHALLGSVAERVVRMSNVPVLTVRGA